MAIISRGYEPNESAAKNTDREFQLFSQNIDLILKHEQAILACSNYFFCSLPFAYSSWLYCSGDGQLFLGYLLLAWKTDIFIEQCPDCNQKVVITSFTGSPLTGSNGWTGICCTCQQIINGKHSAAFRRRMDFVLKLRQAFPATVQEKQEYDGFDFSWGEPSLKPVRKTRIVATPVADPVTLEILIKELKTGAMRDSRPVNVHLLKKKDLKLKFSSNRLNSSCSIP